MAPRDPGYFNWLDTNALNNRLVTLRVEKVTTPDPATIVRTVKFVKLAELAASLPSGIARATPAERVQQLAARRAGFEKRLQR